MSAARCWCGAPIVNWHHCSNGHLQYSGSKTKGFDPYNSAQRRENVKAIVNRHYGRFAQCLSQTHEFFPMPKVDFEALQKAIASKAELDWKTRIAGMAGISSGLFESRNNTI